MEEILDAVVIEPNTEPTAAVIWLHGLGADGNDFAPIIPALNLPQSTPIRFIFPHAKVRPVTINGHFPMRAWFDILTMERGAEEDEMGIRETDALLHTLIQEQINRGIDPANILLAGFSQGGACALFTALRFPDTLAGVIALSCYLPLYKTLAAEASASNKQTPIFQTHGQQDELVPFQFGEMTRDFLLSQGYPLQWKPYAMGHEVCDEEIQDIGAFIKSRLV